MFEINYGKDHKTDWSLRSIKLQVLSNASYQNLFLYLLRIIRPKSDSSETTVTYDQFPRHLSNQQRQINATQSPPRTPFPLSKWSADATVENYSRLSTLMRSLGEIYFGQTWVHQKHADPRICKRGILLIITSSSFGCHSAVVPCQIEISVRSYHDHDPHALLG